MSILTKTRRVLDRHRRTPEWVNFRHVDEDGEVHTAVLLDAASWVDMGNPDQITVTVEPGVLLNDGRVG